MPTLIHDHLDQIEDLCREYRVRRLDVFGPAIRDDFDPGRSDVDFLVEFFSPTPTSTRSARTSTSATRWRSCWNGPWTW